MPRNPAREPSFIGMHKVLIAHGILLSDEFDKQIISVICHQNNRKGGAIAASLRPKLRLRRIRKSGFWSNFGVRGEKIQRGFNRVTKAIRSQNIDFRDLQDDCAVIIQEAAALKKFVRHAVA